MQNLLPRISQSRVASGSEKKQLVKNRSRLTLKNHAKKRQEAFGAHRLAVWLAQTSFYKS
jgi:hypothetical protein